MCFTIYIEKRKGKTLMSNVPVKINNVISEFVQGVNEILGNRVKKIVLFYMNVEKEGVILSES